MEKSELVESLRAIITELSAVISATVEKNEWESLPEYARHMICGGEKCLKTALGDLE